MTTKTTYPTAEQIAAVPDEVAEIAARLLDECVAGHLDDADREGEDHAGPHPISIEGDARTIVAAVGPLLAAQLFEGVADAIEETGQISPEGFRALARLTLSALSRPTAEEQ